ncbi:hypothetical protein UVI_02017680 [Ustilaginoidea virens]|nr:hypothetical protein UVI_02017680 [Ustilaginoidea virens]
MDVDATLPEGASVRAQDTPGEQDAGRQRTGSGFTPLLRVFRYTDARGWALNAVALAAMVGSGTALPLMDLVFGGFVNVFDRFVAGKLSPDTFMAEVGRYT